MPVGEGQGILCYGVALETLRQLGREIKRISCLHSSLVREVTVTVWLQMIKMRDFEGEFAT